MVGFWGKRKRDEEQAQHAEDTERTRKAGAALVAADERIRTTTDELEFARMELGDAAVKDLDDAITAVRKHLREAYQLNQLNHDDIPDTSEELRTRNARIEQLCEWAEQVLDERTEQLAAKVAFARRAPEVLISVRETAEALRERIPAAAETVERLRERYTDDALRQISGDASEAEKLLEFAARSADLSERRRAVKKNEEANLALETATEAVRRATGILDGIDDFELEAMRAESTLSDVVNDARADLVAAREVQSNPRVIEAARNLAAALKSLPGPSQRADPFTDLSTLRSATSALEAAVSKAVERAQRPVPTVDTVRHALDDADRQIAIAGNVIHGHRGWIGVDARTRLAEAERLRADANAQVNDEDQREGALQLARRSGGLASDALRLAQRDIDSSRNDGWGGGNGGGNNGGGMGSLIGGVVLGSILGGMFD